MENTNIVIISFEHYPAINLKFLKIIIRVYTKENLFAQNDKSFFAYKR
jgi:hypothetical protein